MYNLTITRLVEGWAQNRRKQRVLSEAVVAGAVACWVVAITITVVAWAPNWTVLLIPAALVVLGLAALVVARWGRTATAFEVAAEVDKSEGTAGLLRTALSVERGLADCSDASGDLVQLQAIERAKQLGHVGAPALRTPVSLLVLAGIAVVVGVGGVVSGTLLRVEPVTTSPSQSNVAAAFQRADVRRLSQAVDALDALSRQPGVTPISKRDLQRARDHLRKALAAQGDLRQATRELDRAQALIQGLSGRDLLSSEALRQTRPEDLADGLDTALEQNDAGLARRLGEEVLRRVDSGTNAAEMRRLGRTLTERVDGSSPAGAAAQDAGRALQTGDTRSALSSLAELMAHLGEAARYEPRPVALAAAEDAIRDARLRALSSLGEDKAPPGYAPPGEGSRSRSGDAPDERVTQQGEGNSPSPLEMGADGQRDDGTGEGGSEDLRPSGAPGMGGDPEVRVDGPVPAGGQEGAPADGGSFAAGEGPARDGAVPEDAPAGAGDGAAQSDGGTPSSEGPGAGGAAVAGVSPAAAGGMAADLSTAPNVASPFIELEPGSVAEEWVKAQWDGAGQRMGETLQDADAGGRSGMAWNQIHNRYSALAEAATRRDRVPLTRRAYVRQYFEAIRPAADSDSSQESP